MTPDMMAMPLRRAGRPGRMAGRNPGTSMYDFDELIDRRGTHCAKWDMMEPLYGVSPEDGLPMWVADMDFRPPSAVTEALRAALDHGVFGYFGDDRAYKAAIAGWMARRHGWEVDPAWIGTSNGLVAGTAMCLQAFTAPGDGVILFTPVYHAFARIIRANGRSWSRAGSSSATAATRWISRASARR